MQSQTQDSRKFTHLFGISDSRSFCDFSYFLCTSIFLVKYESSTSGQLIIRLFLSFRNLHVMPPASPGIWVDAGGKLLLGAFQETSKSTQADCQSWEKEKTPTLLSSSIQVLLHLHCYSSKPFCRHGRTQICSQLLKTHVPQGEWWQRYTGRKAPSTSNMRLTLEGSPGPMLMQAGSALAARFDNFNHT